VPNHYSRNNKPILWRRPPQAIPRPQLQQQPCPHLATAAGGMGNGGRASPLLHTPTLCRTLLLLLHCLVAAAARCWHLRQLRVSNRCVSPSLALAHGGQVREVGQALAACAVVVAVRGEALLARGAPLVGLVHAVRPTVLLGKGNGLLLVVELQC